MPHLYRKVLYNITFWLVTETILNIAGLDTIANYGEFISAHKNSEIAIAFSAT
ncbi:hypothetical protein K9N68_29220 [Kovacikia minuta CCNUW1]|uniref:hypothetical protein n=1 Tax=Kovacikia minuta TaxID=2931930 RepID=UPI001CCF5516|nr:hypothetical protein [Kovacikia minuta]UBF25605.1 hypothetical protein K9N68_29220 [Kovacikia minuta CCNUW1]